MAYTLQDDGFYHVPIVALGTRLRDNFGLDVAEHSAFGGVGKHSANSHHYYDEALDIRDFRDDVIDGVDWTTRTGNLQNLLKGSGSEVIGPNSGDPNHATHLHLAAHGGIFKLNQQQYDTLFGGGAGGKNATFASFTAPETPQETDGTPKPAQVEAKTRAKAYADMSKSEMNAAYDKLRAEDPAKARVEGMKMHKAFFGK